MDRHQKDSLFILIIAISGLIFSASIGYIAGKHDGTAVVKFELLPCR